MRIVVHVLLALECLALQLQLVAEYDIQVFSLIRSLLVPNTIHIKLWVVGILHVVACVMSVCLLVDASVHEVDIEVLDEIELTLQVNHWTSLALLINKVKRRDVGILSHLGIISTKCRSDVNDTCTVIDSNVVAEDHAESLAIHLYELIATILRSEYLLRMSCCIFCNESWSESIYLLAWLYPWQKLLVVHAFEVGTLHVVDNTPWALLLLLVEWKEIALLALLVSLQI